MRPEIVSKGHRNPQGFDWTGDRMISTEHGPSGGDGPQGFDEVNEIRQGGNYGWPEAFGDDHDGFDAPLRVYDDAIAPSGATFVEREGSDVDRRLPVRHAARREPAAAALRRRRDHRRRAAARGALRPAAHRRRGTGRDALRADQQPRRPRRPRGRRRPDPRGHSPWVSGTPRSRRAPPRASRSRRSAAAAGPRRSRPSSAARRRSRRRGTCAGCRGRARTSRGSRSRARWPRCSRCGRARTRPRSRRADRDLVGERDPFDVRAHHAAQRLEAAAGVRGPDRADLGHQFLLDGGGHAVMLPETPHAASGS